MDRVRLLAALAAVGVGVGTVAAGGNRVGELVEVGGGVIVDGGIVVDGGHCKGLCVRTEFERTRKMGSENESENDHFCKSEGRVRFFKNDHFSVHFRVILKFIFEKWKKNETENEPKMARKWLL